MRALLSSDELARMAAFGHERDRTLYLWSRGLMRSVLASYLGCECAGIRFTANEFGKPVLTDQSLCFNLTHTRGAIAFALSREHDVGVDVEERDRRVDYVGLARRYFAAREAQHIEELGEADRPTAFFAIWTLKEAYVKGLGRGLTFPLDAFAFELDVHRLIAFRALADFVACDWHFHQFDLGPRHCGAIAIQGSPARVVMHDWTQHFLDV
jgi:4'-phosphopantetheinyl transferase